MASKQTRKAGKQPEGKGKAKAKAVAISPLLDAENAAVLAASGAKYNVDLITSSSEALEELKRGTWPGVQEEEALGLGQGASLAPFDAAALRQALFPGGVADPNATYICSQNFFKCDLLFNADPTVPVRHKSVNDLSDQYYSEPSRFHGKVKVAVHPEWAAAGCDSMKAKPVSPAENIMSYILSMYRDNQDEDKIAQWKKFALSVEFEYCVASSDQEIYFLTTNLRQSFAVDKETMYHTSLQRMFSVIACKSRMEKIHGPLSTANFCQMYGEHVKASSEAEKVTDSFVETAICMSKRVLSSDAMLGLLLAADEHPSDSNPFNHYSKLQIMINKGRNPRNIEWIFQSMYDGWVNGHLSSDMLSYRGINNGLHGKGTCEYFIGQLELREYLFAKVVPSYGWDASIITQMKEVSSDHAEYRKMCGYSKDKFDLTWRAGWPKSAELFWTFLEDALFSNTFETTFKNLVRHRKPVAEWISSSEVENRLSSVFEQAEKETKEKKKQQKAEAGEDEDEDDVSMVVPVQEDAAEDETGTGHLKVPLPAPPKSRGKKTDTDDAENAKEPTMDEESLKKVEAFKQKACAMVRTHVKLVCEEDNIANMTKALSATAFPKWKGEIDAGPNQVVKLVAIYFDTKVCGEAGTQPSLRLPPLREGRHNKLLMSAISLRVGKETGSLPAGDAVLLQDGGRDGLTTSLLSAVRPSATENMVKAKALKFLMWDERAIRTKKNRNKGSHVNQLEKLHIVMSDEYSFAFKKRKHFSGTSHGDCIGPILAPSWDDEDETWTMTYAQKKELYGVPNRIAVGGKSDLDPPDNQKGARRKDTDKEPVAYHALPSEVVSELFHEFNIGYMLDLSCCDGKTAWEAILRRVPFIGICFTPDHVSDLMKRLESKCWQGMLNPESPLFEPTLAGLISKSGKKNRKAKAEAKKKKKDDEDEEEGEGDDDEEDEGDGEDDEEEGDEGEGEEEEEEEEEQNEASEDEDDGNEEEEDDEENEDDGGSKGVKRKAGAKTKAKAKAKGKGEAKGCEGQGKRSS